MTIINHRAGLIGEADSTAENYCPGCRGYKQYYQCACCCASHLMRCAVCDTDKVLPDTCAHCLQLNRHGRRRAAALRRHGRHTQIHFG